MMFAAGWFVDKVTVICGGCRKFGTMMAARWFVERVKNEVWKLR